MPQQRQAVPFAPKPMTLLQIACGTGYARVVMGQLGAAAANGSLEQELLQTGGSDGMTPLGWAAYNGHDDVAQLLLAHMPERQLLHNSALGHNALTVAAMQGHAELCEQLLRFVPEQQLAHVPDADCPCCSRNTALIAAAANGHVKVAKALLVHMPERQVLQQVQDGVTALYAAVMRNSPDLVAELLQYATAQQISLKDSQQCTVLHLAAMKGYVTIMQQLLATHDPVQQVLCIDEYGCMPVHLATTSGHTDAVRCLLAHSPERQLHHQDLLGGTLMLYAADNANVAIMRLLLSCGGDIGRLLRDRSRDRMTPLMMAARQGSAAVVRLLLQHSPDWQVQQVDERGYNALMYALATEKEGEALKMVRLLLRHSPEVQVQQVGREGGSALMFAMYRCERRTAKELLKYCPAKQMEAVGLYGESPLSLAVGAADVDLVLEMLGHVTDPAALTTGLRGFTNVHRSGVDAFTDAFVTKAQSWCCQLLLDAGADPTTLTAEQLAAFKRARPEVQKLVHNACERRWKEQRQAQERQEKAERAAAALLAEEEAHRAKAQAAQAKKDKKKQKRAAAKAQKAAAQADAGGQDVGSGGAGEEDESAAAAAEGISDAGPSCSSGGAGVGAGSGSGSSSGGGQDSVEGVNSDGHSSASALMAPVAGVSAHPLPLATEPVPSSSCEDDRWCVVCLERRSCQALVPCGHIVMCAPCCEAVQASKNECPMCREGILAVLAINL